MYAFSRRSVLSLAVASAASVAIAQEQGTPKKAGPTKEKSKDAKAVQASGAELDGRAHDVGDGKILYLRQHHVFINKPADGGLGIDRTTFPDLPEDTKTFTAWLIGWSAFFHDNSGSVREAPISKLHFTLEATLGEENSGQVAASAQMADADEADDDGRAWTAEVSYMVVAIG